MAAQYDRVLMVYLLPFLAHLLSQDPTPLAHNIVAPDCYLGTLDDVRRMRGTTYDSTLTH